MDVLLRDPNIEEPFHPATEEFLEQFLAFREQLETDHDSVQDHAVFEEKVERLETALLAVRELITRRS